MTTARAALTLAAFLSTLLLMPWTAWAYRPFISTDAAVADQRDLEIELGYFALEQAKGENTFRVPSLVLNYGAWKNTEIVGEFRIERNPRGDIDVVDPGLFLKAVLKEGLLQEKPGVSFAIEAGPLLPSTVAGERGVGFEAVGILSGRVAPLTLHLNGGGGLDRAAAHPFGVWGLISELRSCLGSGSWARSLERASQGSAPTTRCWSVSSGSRRHRTCSSMRAFVGA